MRSTIENVCGHTRDYNIYGPAHERDRKIKWLQTQVCPECKRDRTAKALLVEHEQEIQRRADNLLAALAKESDPLRSITMLQHQLAEGLGTEITREAARRAIDVWRTHIKLEQ